MKKVLSIIMVLAMLMSMIGCSKQSTSSETPTAAPTSSVDEQTTDDAGEQTAASTEPVTFSIFIDHSWFWLDSWGKDPVSQEITKKTGVSFEVTRATDGNQLALMIASGDLPDIIYTANTSVMSLLSDENICYPYNKLVDQYKVDIHATDSEIQNNTRSDGNYYALLNAYTSQEAIDEGNTLLSGGTSSLAYRTDIYEAIGSPQLNTLEDLENALLAAKEKYPDVIPLLNDGLGYFQQQLGMKGSGSVAYNANGEPCYWLNAEFAKDYFALLNRFAREGLISAEAQTYNYEKFSSVRNSGGSFMQARCADEAVASNNAAKEAGTGYTWKLLTNELNDNALCNVNTGIGWSGTFITKNCANPERAIQFMSWCRSEEGRKLCSWGIQGVHWDYNDAGETVTTQEYRDAIASGKSKQADFGVAAWIFGDQGDENAFIDHAVTDSNSKDIITRLQSAVKHTAVMSELYFCNPTEGDELNIMNSLNDLCTSETLRVIFAENDEEYQKALDNLYKHAEELGMSKLESWMKEALNKHLAN